MDLEASLAVALKRPALVLRELDRLDCEDRLLAFIRRHWKVLEPNTPFVEGWALEAICEHLEAVTAGEINRLLINVPPGFSKSLATDVFWPAWEWARGLAHLRYVAFSYAAALTERDNRRFRDLMLSRPYQELWGSKFNLLKIGETLVSNDKTGWKLASSVGGVGTGERGDRVILDDPHNIKEGESDAIRNETVRWFRESMSNRLNDMERSAIVIIMQRVHDTDVSGTILTEGMGYEHLCIPMEYDRKRLSDDDGQKRQTAIGWEDPREEDGCLAWPERFPSRVVDNLKVDLGSYAYASQYQQSPVPRKGGILQSSWWKVFPEEGEQFLPNGKPVKPLNFPDMEFILASVDTAMSVKEENDWSACTIWGVWRDSHDRPKLMLMEAWHARLEFSALVTKIIEICRRRGVDRLLVEAKANGISVAQEIVRLCGSEKWGTTPAQVKGDKVVRAWSVQHLLEGGLVYTPNRPWSQLVIDECAAFPRGAHDDLVDTTTLALRFLRDTGLMQFAHERDDDLRRRFGPPGERKPVYDV